MNKIYSMISNDSASRSPTEKIIVDPYLYPNENSFYHDEKKSLIKKVSSFVKVNLDQAYKKIDEQIESSGEPLFDAKKAAIEEGENKSLLTKTKLKSKSAGCQIL